MIKKGYKLKNNCRFFLFRSIRFSALQRTINEDWFFHLGFVFVDLSICRFVIRLKRFLFIPMNRWNACTFRYWHKSRKSTKTIRFLIIVRCAVNHKKSWVTNVRLYSFHELLKHLSKKHCSYLRYFVAHCLYSFSL